MSLSLSITVHRHRAKSIKGMGGVLHKYFDFIFRSAYCGVDLFLNGFLKSIEKLIAENSTAKNRDVNVLTPGHIGKRHLAILYVNAFCSIF